MNFDELKQQCLACQRCGLCETRTHVVFGRVCQTPRFFL